jgi:hypothetical protein
VPFTSVKKGRLLWYDERMNDTANLTELWEHDIADDENAGALDWQPRFVWRPHAVVKVTPKRIYTESLRRTADGLLSDSVYFRDPDGNLVELMAAR